GGSAPPQPHPLDELTARELLLILDEEVQALPEVYRLPLILCCLEGRTGEEAAADLGWTSGSLRARLVRGRRRLHARLVRRGLELAAGVAAVEAARAVGAASAGALALRGRGTVRAGRAFGAQPGEPTPAGGL